MAAFNRYKLAHATLFSYDGTVSESYNELRLRPRHDETQSCLSFRITTYPFSKPAAHLDYFNNWFIISIFCRSIRNCAWNRKRPCWCNPLQQYAAVPLPLAEFDQRRELLADEYFRLARAQPVLPCFARGRRHGERGGRPLRRKRCEGSPRPRLR